ncbi:Glycosyl transferase family 2 [Brevibacterium sandarakinum]|uniref:Glycosyl transferase family 2 n=1 Tax=Brevibacterium sandarakinum TaxID=629680 RepID=A0A1H1PSJ5_BRESA|nr:glycosyltransferase [Brevibacterium sandarakinum]SDS14321.1 Glycosyl transferase family 2 [Brevibacterium sandarakinum]
MKAGTLTALLACDIRYDADPLGKAWMDSLVAALIARGWVVHVLVREVDAAIDYENIRRAGGQILSPGDVPADHRDEHGHAPRFRARTIVRSTTELTPDIVVVQGRTLSRFVAGSGHIDTRLWTIPLDHPYTGGRFDHADFSDLATIAKTSNRILVADEIQRSTLDSEFPAASSKVRILPLFGQLSHSIESTDLSEAAALHIHEGLFADHDVEAFEHLGSALRERRQIPRIHIHDDPSAAGLSTASDPGSAQSYGRAGILRTLPGVVSSNAGAASGSLVLPSDPIARHYGLLLAQAQGRSTTDLDPAGGSASTSLVSNGPDSSWPDSSDEVSADLVPEDFQPSLDPLDEAAVEPIAAVNSRPLKMVIAGSDFKFAGDLVETFLSDPSFDVRFDLFDHHSHPQPKKSRPYVEWAEVILAEFAVYNAIWYSQKVASHQTLIVHLHGFELNSDWIAELDIDRVAAVVVPSEFYRRRAHELRGWPLDKLVVIPNSVNPFDLVRPKHDDARFHLGLVGMVPILKRPDRALDLLERLTAIDDRYILHIRGHAPWNYSWEWKKAAHQDAYRDFYTRLGRRPELQRAIAFEPFAPDMGNWLRKIGWILSPSSRETFHLAAIEGATSGAVPLAWEREGAQEIIGEEWTFASTDEIHEYILAHNDTADGHSAAAGRAQKHAERYRSDTVGHRWRSVVHETFSGAARTTAASVPSGVTGSVFSEVDALVTAGEFDEAKGALDRNIQITKNDASKLKDLELFVRGVLALDTRRTELLPPNSPTGQCARTSQQGGGTETYVLISALATGSSGSSLVTDPTVVPASLGIVPFGYTGERLADDVRVAAYRTAAGTARSAAAHSGPIVTDVLEDHRDAYVAVRHGLRFDRWVEAVASELRDHLGRFESSQVLIEGPWHTALPAAIAAVRMGRRFVWAPPVESTKNAVEAISSNPYTGDIRTQFIGLLISRAAAVLVPEAQGSVEEPSVLHRQIRNRVDMSAVRRTGIASADTVRFDSRTVDQIEELSASLNGSHPLGALNSPMPSPAGGDRTLRLAVLADERFVHRLNSADGVVEAMSLNSSADLDPSFDALIVDDSALAEPHSMPGTGTLTQRIRSLFDLARSFGVLGIFNSESNVGGVRSATTAAEKADALTGTRALFALELLARNPNSITRVGSSSLMTGNGPELRAALAAVGVGTVGSDLERRRPTGQSTDGVRVDPARLRITASDGVSLVVATRLGAQRLPTMLATVAAQTMHPSRMELVIVHNGPEDGTRSVVEAFAEANPKLTVRYAHSDIEGASPARNLGLELITRDYVTFVDDDDEIEHNYVLNMWLSAGDDLVVAAPLRDVTAEGISLTDLPNNRRLANLSGRRIGLNRASGLLGMNACKLIPSRVARSIQYPTGLRSGEDVAYMSQLLLHDLELVPADTAPDSAYVRHMRPDSVSRRELTRDFAVDQRLGVITQLERVRAGGPTTITGCIRALQMDQLSFIARYLTENPHEGEEVIGRVLHSGVPTSQLAGRYKSMHSLALKIESSPV